jgi:hypothetical protein
MLPALEFQISYLSLTKTTDGTGMPPLHKYPFVGRHAAWQKLKQISYIRS